MTNSDLDDASIGTCENCKTENTLVRRIPQLDSFTGKIRQYRNICFKCFRPRVYVKGRGITYESPMLPEKAEEAINRKLRELWRVSL